MTIVQLGQQLYQMTERFSVVVGSYSGGARFDTRKENRICDWSFRRFPQSLAANDIIVPRVGHDRFLPNPFQFIIHR
jgi:hypothetical protein